MEFITTDGKLEISNGIIIQKRLTNTRRANILFNIYFFIFFLNKLLEQFDKLTIEGKQKAWIGIILNGIFVLLFVVAALYILFKHVLSNKVDINSIKEISFSNSEEGLDRNVIVKTKANRLKIYKFRLLEKEYEKFVESILLQNALIKVVTS